MNIILPPDWFFNIDIFIEAISFITVLIFSALCIKNYKLNKDKKFLYLGWGFILITVAELIITVTKAVLYYDASFIGLRGEIAVPYNLYNFISIFYNGGVFIYKLLTLLGLYIVYKIPDKVIERESILVLYLIIITAIFSMYTVHLFHITALILLSLIIMKYYTVYRKNKSNGTLILMMAFSLLALSNAIYIFARLLSLIYVTASIIELASYITLLALIIGILEYGKKYSKKKKQNGYNI